MKNMKIPKKHDKKEKLSLVLMLFSLKEAFCYKLVQCV